METSATYHTVDVAKLVAAILVVAIHSQPFTGLTEIVAVRYMARMAVPFFFLASAFFFFKRPKERQSWRHYVRRLLLLYLFWFVIELPITVLHAFIEPNASFSQNLMHFVRNLFFGSTFYGSWFLTALVECIPAICLLSKVLRTSVLCAIGVVLYAVVVLFTYYQGFFPETWQQLARSMGHIETTFLAAFAFCAFGKWIAENEDFVRNARNLNPLLGLSLVLGLIEVVVVNSMNPPSANDCYFMLLVMVPLMFVFLLRHEAHADADYRRLRMYSTVMYFSHFVFVFIFVVVNKHFMPIPPLVKYVSVLMLSLLSSEIIRRISGTTYGNLFRYSY